MEKFNDYVYDIWMIIMVYKIIKYDWFDNNIVVIIVWIFIIY